MLNRAGKCAVSNTKHLILRTFTVSHFYNVPDYSGNEISHCDQGAAYFFGSPYLGWLGGGLLAGVSLPVKGAFLIFTVL